MQVAPVNNSAASVSGSTAAEETDSRAREFSRLLQNAFFSQGTKAVARSSEPTAPQAASRSETRNDTRADTRGDSRPDTQIRAERPAADSNPAPSKPSNSTTNESSAPGNAPARNETAPGKDSKPADKPVAGGQDKPSSTDTSKPSAETAPETDPAMPAEETADADPAAETVETPVVLDADAALILGLLQMQAQTQPNAAPVVPQQAETPVAPAASVIPAATDAAAEAQLQAQLLAATAGQTAPAATPALPGETAPAVPAASAADAGTDKPEAPPALPQAAKPADAPAAPVLPQPAALPAEMMVAAKSGTDTSPAALLAQQPQQPAMTPEQLAALQAAMQTDGELQTALQDQMPRQPQGESQPSGDPAPKQAAGKGLLLDVQPATTTAKPAVDQAVLLAAQGDAEAASEQMLVQQQLTAAQHHQSAAEAKFTAALHAQMNGDAQPPAVAAATAQSASATQQGVQPAPMSNPGTSMPQAVQHATTQTLARQLGAHIPAGEQVAVQIRKGVAEGADKISIKLDPGNLGKVEVKLEVGHDGKLLAVIAADKPETLAMLQRDSQQLEQSLRDVGLKTDANSLSFSLREQGQNADGRDGQGNTGRQRGRGHEEYVETGHVVDAAAQAASNAQRAAAARGGLDIRI
ncbi:MAG: flagellar hook-length control protein FliK [Ferrovibrio sp.]|uniref:flagellar hook-length control protein FliK n=1 Tax=Ferrovibrio sp. TaxID=1917215 RepID=UPI00391C4634